MGSFWADLAAWALAVLKHWNGYVGSGIFSVVLLVIGGKDTPIGFHLAGWTFALLRGFFLAWRDATREARALRAQLTPQLNVDFRPECCVVRDSFHTYVRVGISNLSRARMTDMAVYVEALNPGFADKRQLPWSGESSPTISLDPTEGRGHHHIMVMKHAYEHSWFLAP